MVRLFCCEYNKTDCYSAAAVRFAYKNMYYTNSEIMLLSLCSVEYTHFSILPELMK